MGESSSKQDSLQNANISTNHEDHMYPNLTNLLEIVPLSAMQNYPKLALLVQEALEPFIEVFDNQFVSFFKLCEAQKLIEKKRIWKPALGSSTATQTPEAQEIRQTELNERLKL